MAQSTKTPIVTYHSTVAAAVPSNANLQAGELAVNIADMKLYTENSSGTVTLLASADAAAGNFTTVDTTNLEVTNIKAKDGAAAIVLTNSTGAVTVSSPFATTGNTTLGNASADTVTVTGTITSNLIFTDNTYDIGASGATRPRDMFLAGNATIGGNIDLTGALDLTNLEVTNIKAKDGTASASIADATGVMTIASSVLTTTDINGGTIDGAVINGGTIDSTVIGGTTPADGTFNSLLAVNDGYINFMTVGRSGGNISSNTAVGSLALGSNSTGSGMTAVGFQALRQNSTGGDNSAFGINTLYSNIAGSSNSAFGYQALFSNTASSNTGFGYAALFSNISGAFNTSVGASTLFNNTAANNTALGYSAGSANTSGTNNTFIGYNAQGASTTTNNAITLGNSSVATLRCQVTTITALSDRRDKKDIVDIPAGLNLVEKLRPVSFAWNMRDGGKVGIPEFGFIAQELQEAQSAAGVTVPNLVSEENPEKLEASAGTLIPVLVKAIQELKRELDLVKSELASLKGA
jgi:hypothetical protein